MYGVCKPLWIRFCAGDVAFWPQRIRADVTETRSWWLTGECVLGLIGGLHEVPDGQVAQSVEQGTENPRVGSSILSLATILAH